MARIRVYIATSMDGFIAGPEDDLSWLPTAHIEETDAVTFEGFLTDVGVLLMGRRTYDVVRGFEGDWPYGELPVLVATSRTLDDAPATVTPVGGTITSILAEAKQVAGERDVYLDGGNLVQQALEANAVDELIVTVVPILLGGGVRLFGETSTRIPLQFEAPQRYGSMVQLRACRLS